MGWRFRKSVKMGPFRLNYSKKGVGWSVGAAGVRYTQRADGKRTVTTTIRGTGLSRVSYLKKEKTYPASNEPSVRSNTGSAGAFWGWACIVIGILIGMSALFSEDGSSDVFLVLFLLCIGIGALLIYCSRSREERGKTLEDSMIEEADTPDCSQKELYWPNLDTTAEVAVYNRRDAQVIAPQCLKQLKETQDILNTTTNPETFFSRYDFLIGLMKVLTACEKYISFKSERLPSEELGRVVQKSFRDEESRQMIDRCFEKSCEKIAVLKTQRGKRNEAERFNKAFDSCREYMNETLQQYQQEKHQQLVKIADGEAGIYNAQPEQNAAETQKQFQQFEERYDLTTEKGISAIPTEKIFASAKDVASMPEQILSRKATEYKKSGQMDLAIACLKKANELRQVSPLAYTRADYERLVDYMVEAGQYDEARSEHRRLDQILGSWEEELLRLEEANSADEEERKRYESELIPAQRAKMASREQYYWLREHFPDLAPKSFNGYCRMKNQNTVTFQKLTAAVLDQGMALENVRFWT